MNITFVLDKYIDEYIKEVDDTDKTVALHLKEIIPQTTHLNQETFKEIIEQLKKKMDKGNNFKTAFKKVCEKYILTGDVIKAPLPLILTRIILNESKFLKEVARNFSVAPDMEESLDSIIQPEDIIYAVNSKDYEEIEKTFEDSKLLSKREVVFAAFDESNPDSDPFIYAKIEDIINLLALDKSVFKESEPLTAVSIRYRNNDDVIKRFPVFVDAGWYDKFYPSDNNDKYGRTKPLDVSSGGMPEIVHKNLRLADVIEEIRFLEE